MPKKQILTTKVSQASLAGCLLLCLLLLISDSAAVLQGHVSAQSSCPQLNVPATTHGFTTTAGLPGGDHFLLAQPFTLTLPSVTPVLGLSSFVVNAANFGGDAAGIGGFAGTSLSGLSFAAPNGSVTFVSCLDSIWDIGFELASAGSTVGDTVTFFVQKPDGTGVINLAVFTHESGGVRLTTLPPNGALFRNDRLAQQGRIQAGELISLNVASGAAGNRSDLLVLAFDPAAGSSLNDCFQFGATLARGGDLGASALVFTDFVLKRMEQAGDRALTGTGLLGGLTGGFPTGLVCQEACPVCPVQQQLVCPANQTVCPPAGSTSATVTYATPTGATCTPASGSSFPTGVTTVNCTAPGATSCSFTVTATPNVTLTCPTNITTTATSASGVTVTYSAPTVTPTGTAVTCAPASGTTFPVGTTTVTCTANGSCGAATCSFTVTVGAPAPVKCDTFCWRSPQWWLLNPRRIPQGNVLISGVNGNLSVSTDNLQTILRALQGNPTGFSLTASQRFNQEYVAAQLNLILAGGQGSVVNANVLWTNLSCYGINFAPVQLSNGFTLTPALMVKDLFMQAQFVATQNRAADFAPLAALLDRFNGNDVFGCN
ncbi:MAG: HYR domain-containing protein [Acidobacteria bacterium]|nr:HYR domain-containing protein [Acidobacteriota bacterium]